MARRHMSVYLSDGTKVRTFGGNGSDVKRMCRLYANMTKEQFLSMHPKFKDICDRNIFKLYVDYSGNHNTIQLEVEENEEAKCNCNL